MSDVASRDLRNDTRAVLRRVEMGEHVVITVRGRAVAELRPLARRHRWLPRQQFAQLIGAAAADAGLADELRALAPDTTDDLPL